MRTREKLTLEEKFALALALIKREQSLDEIREQYRISHTTAYKIRNAFLEGGRAALSGERKAPHASNLEARVSALEALLGNRDGGERRGGNGRNGRRRIDGRSTQARRVGSVAEVPPVADTIESERRLGK
jgi:hypothetical protein